MHDIRRPEARIMYSSKQLMPRETFDCALDTGNQITFAPLLSRHRSDRRAHLGTEPGYSTRIYAFYALAIGPFSRTDHPKEDLEDLGRFRWPGLQSSYGPTR
jgi:hypothetical protein